MFVKSSSDVAMKNQKRGTKGGVLCARKDVIDREGEVSQCRTSRRVNKLIGLSLIHISEPTRPY